MQPEDPFFYVSDDTARFVSLRYDRSVCHEVEYDAEVAEWLSIHHHRETEEQRSWMGLQTVTINERHYFVPWGWDIMELKDLLFIRNKELTLPINHYDE